MADPNSLIKKPLVPLKEGMGSLFYLFYGAVAIVMVTYAGELMYLQIWQDHSPGSVYCIIALACDMCFTTR